jgi:hypothetical protein
MREKALGPNHSDVGDTLRAFAELRVAQGKPAEAVRLLDRALSIADTYSKPEFEMALAELLAKSDAARARALAEEARTTYERLGHRPGLLHADRFLAEHPR